MAVRKRSAANPNQGPFELPKSISRALKRCVDAQTHQEPVQSQGVKYLWLYLTTDERVHGRKGAAKELASEEWLNILDEAASLGAQCVLVCVAPPLKDYARAISLCRWAQEAHSMMVGVYIYDGGLSEEDLDAFDELDRERMCLFVNEEHLAESEHIAERGIHVCSGSVTEDDHTPPCDLPGNMLCVGPEGNLYTCGLVLGNQAFNLGNALSKPLREVIEDESLPRSIPGDVRHKRHGCDACPPILAKRAMEFGQNGSA